MQPVSNRATYKCSASVVYYQYFLEEETILNQVLQHNDELLRIWNDDLNQTTERSHH